MDKVIIGSSNWSELFKKHDFFHKYRYYLQVIASTGNADLQIKWCCLCDDCLLRVVLISIYFRAGTVESKLRQLVMKLEYVDSLILAHPFVKGFDRVTYCLSDEEMRLVAQGDISEAIGKRTKQDIEGKEGASTVYSTSFYIGLQIEAKQRDSCIA